MLDFYWLSDREQWPAYPNEEHRLGGITMREFQSVTTVLDEAATHGIRLPYFEDARLSASDVAMLLARMDAYATQRRDSGASFDVGGFGKLAQILRAARGREAGVVTFCD